jgi:hypothetical protein
MPTTITNYFLTAVAASSLTGAAALGSARPNALRAGGDATFSWGLPRRHPARVAARARHLMRRNAVALQIALRELTISIIGSGKCAYLWPFRLSPGIGLSIAASAAEA